MGVDWKSSLASVMNSEFATEHDSIATEHVLQFWLRPGHQLLLKFFVKLVCYNLLRV